MKTTSQPRRIVSDNVYESYIDAIGNTPLIKLNRASKETGCNIYGKAEFMNPGGSVKARAALYLIQDAEKRGLLTPGEPGLIVEATAGNTGISLAEIASARGYKVIIVMPDNQSQEKKDMLRYAGAQVIMLPSKPHSSPNHFIRLAKRLAVQLGAVLANQFENTANRTAHFETTGPEIWAQLKGRIDGFSCAVGSGGTIVGTSRFLKSVSPDIKIALTDPCGGKLVRYYRHGVLESVGESITEGIGQFRITANLEGFEPDLIYEIGDEESLGVAFKLLQEEGLCVGTSSGVNVAGAMRLARELGPGHTIVTILCDHGTRYTAKMFNLEFLGQKGLPAPHWIGAELPRNVVDALHEVTEEEEEEEEGGEGKNGTMMKRMVKTIIIIRALVIIVTNVLVPL